MVKINSIAIIEDDETVLHYLAEQIQLCIDVAELRVFGNAETALKELIAEPVDIALFDVNLPGMNGIDCIRKLKMVHPKTQCMVLTVYDKPDIIFEALKAGAISYLLKSTPAEKIIEAIAEVNKGGSPISSQIARKVIEAFAIKENTNEYFQNLTRREQEILENLSMGYRYKEYNILFETHKKEKELANANLQIAENKLISRQKNLWLIALGCALFIGIIVLRNQKVKASFIENKLQLENQLLQEQAQSQIQQQRLAISRDLHDSIGAQLTFINSILDGLKNLSAQLNATINKKINTLAEFSENSITELRNTLWVLNSKEIFLDDLKVKILNYINHAAEAKETMQFHFNFEAPENYLLSSRQAINLFRAVQEIITNAIKYSTAKEILIDITQKEKLLAIKIADNGTGFDFEKLKNKSYGLSNIQNRVAEINGSLKVETSEGKGTTYFIEILF